MKARMKMKQLTVAVDLDATLARYDGWCGREHIGEPLPGALEAMRALIGAGHKVIVFTCRCSNSVQADFAEDISGEQSAEIVGAWLEANGFPKEIEIWTGHGKPFADCYCDDRAINVSPQKCGLAWGWALEAIEGLAGG